MIIVLLAPASSSHVKSWSNELSKIGLDVHLITMHKPTPDFANSIKIYKIPNFGKAGYFINFLLVRFLLRKIKPHLLNTHYASGYGTTARLTRFSPNILSVWGSDVFDFPQKSRLHLSVIRKNLNSATALASTSECMADQIFKLNIHKKTYITPFGVDTEVFFPKRSQCTSLPSHPFIIGTAKSLKKVYGIDILIRSFSILLNLLKARKSSNSPAIRLRIIGDGPERENLIKLCGDLNLMSHVDFCGARNHSEVADEIRSFSAFALLSRRESFGVAALEASASGVPVVASNVGGLPEIVRHEHTGLIVEPDDPNAAAQAFLRLIDDPSLCLNLGKNGRNRVLENFTWAKCALTMKSLYLDVTSSIPR